MCMCVCDFLSDSEQQSSYHYNDVGGISDNFLPTLLLLLKFLDRSRLLLSSLAHFIGVRIIQQTIGENDELSSKPAGMLFFHLSVFDVVSFVLVCLFFPKLFELFSKNCNSLLDYPG